MIPTGLLSGLGRTSWRETFWRLQLLAMLSPALVSGRLSYSFLFGDQSAKLLDFLEWSLNQQKFCRLLEIFHWQGLETFSSQLLKWIQWAWCWKWCCYPCHHSCQVSVSFASKWLEPLLTLLVLPFFPTIGLTQALCESSEFIWYAQWCLTSKKSS